MTLQNSTKPEATIPKHKPEATKQQSCAMHGVKVPLVPSKLFCYFEGKIIQLLVRRYLDAYALFSDSLCVFVFRARTYDEDEEFGPISGTVCQFLENEFDYGFYFSGFAIQAQFHGKRMNLLEMFNEYVESNRIPLEQIHTRTARILQGYDHMSYVLHHTAGKFVTQEDNGKLTMMFERHNRGSYFDLEVKIDKISELKLLYSPSSIEHMDLPPLDEKPPPFEFGYADPAAITFFDNILFYGDRMFNVSTRSQISSVHPIINYTKGNHF
ncbi:hypothetical protein L596_020348 [Steinernema carpocapsae]|uniref:Uncharacterized protein n=1 Tax=Steinernema carpocapsae TaxID=34508 RepID=A0A4U5MTB6_STECR|nr:hypothetical protein L596_020348 [Steinernema carpocapsae]